MLGIRYAPKCEDGQMAHMGLIAILDRDGRIVAHSQGSVDQKDFLDEISRVVGSGP